MTFIVRSLRRKDVIREFFGEGIIEFQWGKKFKRQGNSNSKLQCEVMNGSHQKVSFQKMTDQLRLMLHVRQCDAAQI
jgi:hypothetical protein